MAGVMDSVNQRTQLVGKNRLELLLFRLSGKQLYGINVFKVKEVLPAPRLNFLPHTNPMVKGVSHIRGATVSVIDLGYAIGMGGVKNLEKSFVIMTEYNGRTQGFLVDAVERIVNTNWEDIHAPPAGAGKHNFLTAVTEFENKMVEIIDVELVLAKVAPAREKISDGLIDETTTTAAMQHHILVVDDSSVARSQIKRCAQTVGVSVTTLNDGQQALKHLKSLVADGVDILSHYSMVISDIEMPEMDGYTLVSEIRNDPRLANLYVVLHTSLSGVFNKAMVDKVGANDFLPKFEADALASTIANRIQMIS